MAELVSQSSRPDRRAARAAVRAWPDNPLGECEVPNAVPLDRATPGWEASARKARGPRLRRELEHLFGLPRRDRAVPARQPIG